MLFSVDFRQGLFRSHPHSFRAFPIVALLCTSSEKSQGKLEHSGDDCEQAFPSMRKKKISQEKHEGKNRRNQISS